MLFDDTYQEISSKSTGLYKEKGSKFIGYSFIVHSEENVKDKIVKVKKLEPSANHYCYAYIIHPDKSLYRVNDDGEPNSTAGRQILNQIKKYNLTNILIVVVRYFGGIKLGIPGLIRSYSTAALLVLENTSVITKNIEEKYSIIFNHSEMHKVMQIVKDYKLNIIDKQFKAKNKLTFMVPKNKSNLVINKFKENHNIEFQFT